MEPTSNEPQSTQAMIIVDHREPLEIIASLRAKSKVEVKQLEMGDYLASDRTVIERKRRPDFEQSIIDQRLFQQMSCLKENYENVIIIVEGAEPYIRLREESILGAYTSVITDFKCSLFFTRNAEATADIVYSIAKHEQFAKKRSPGILVKRKASTMHDKQRMIIESLPNVGPQLAANLLDHFGSVKKVLTAKKEKLMKVDKVGEKKATEIINVLESKYEKEPKND